MVSLRPRAVGTRFSHGFWALQVRFPGCFSTSLSTAARAGQRCPLWSDLRDLIFRLNILRPPKTLWRLDFKRFCSKATASQLCELKWGLQSGPTSVWIQDSELELLINHHWRMPTYRVPQGCSAMWHRLWRPIEQSQRNLPKQPLAEESGSMPSVRFQCLFPSKEFSTCSTSTLRMRSQSNDTSARASSCILLEKGFSRSSVVSMQLAGFCFLSCCHRDSRVEQALMIWYRYSWGWSM